MQRFWKYWDDDMEGYLYAVTESNDMAFLYAAMGWVEISEAEFEELRREGELEDRHLV